jgi:ArsR family transcriptional regulator, arsenate/arsenite/antimonite-responsive transcriptional repressor
MAIHIRTDRRELAAAAERLRRAGHPLRLAMIGLLQGGPGICVCALAAALPAAQATVSRHLRILKDGGLVRARRDGANVFYSLHEENAAALLRQLARLLGGDVRPAPRRGRRPAPGRAARGRITALSCEITTDPTKASGRRLRPARRQA